MNISKIIVAQVKDLVRSNFLLAITLSQMMYIKSQSARRKSKKFSLMFSTCTDLTLSSCCKTISQVEVPNEGYDMLRSMKGVTNPRKIDTNLGYTKVGPKKGKINDKPEKKEKRKRY